MRTAGCASALLVLLACTTTAPPEAEPPETVTPARTVVRLHLGPTWFKHRGAQLGLSPAEAKARDGRLGENSAPDPMFWDDQMAMTTATVWRVLCNECHAGKRSVARAASIAPPPDGWPPPRDHFFARTRSVRRIYRKIAEGGREEDAGPTGPMPAFRGKLAREQIWGLIYFIQVASREGTVRER